MRRQKEAADIYSVLKPVFFMSKILGLSPYNVVGDTNRSEVRVSALTVVYSVGMCVLITCILGHVQFKRLHLWGNICNSSESILVLGTSCNLVLAYSTILLSSRRIARLFNRLIGLVRETSYSTWKRDLKTMLSVQFLVAIMLVTAGVLEFSVIVKDYDTVLSATYYYAAELACFVSENQFVVIIIVLKRIIQNWNFHICAVSEKENIANLSRSTEFTNKEGSNLFSFSNKSTISSRENVNSIVTHFRYIRKQHASACELAESVNSVYSAMLLFSVARTFISLTHALYYVLMDFIVQKKSFSCDTRENNSYYVWLLYYAFRLIWLVYATNFTAKEINRTAVEVHRLLGKTNYPTLREELQEFSLDLLHRKVQFTACGFFPLDYTLLCSIVGAVTTYLVILTQFQLAMPDSSKNITIGAETHHVIPDSSEIHYPQQ